ncbi:MAG: EAL domain-containing protein, partial [Planctomycetota bacterium]
TSDGFIQTLNKTVSEHGLQPRDIKIEITENLMLKDDETSFDMFCDLREMGYELLLDDFGTGFCSLSYLHRFPIDTLKIDKSFTQSMLGDESSLAIVRTILALAEVLDLTVVGEGVETREQQNMLSEMGCDLLQGFLYAKPMSGDETLDYIRQFSRSESPQDDR